MAPVAAPMSILKKNHMSHVEVKECPMSSLMSYPCQEASFCMLILRNDCVPLSNIISRKFRSVVQSPPPPPHTHSSLKNYYDSPNNTSASKGSGRNVRGEIHISHGEMTKMYRETLATNLWLLCHTSQKTLHNLFSH